MSRRRVVVLCPTDVLATAACQTGTLRWRRRTGDSTGRPMSVYTIHLTMLPNLPSLESEVPTVSRFHDEDGLLFAVDSRGRRHDAPGPRTAQPTRSPPSTNARNSSLSEFIHPHRATVGDDGPTPRPGHRPLPRPPRAHGRYCSSMAVTSPEPMVIQKGFGDRRASSVG
jgi:hypothetical protein